MKYILSCFRVGKDYCNCSYKKGIFKKKFKSLSDIAAYIIKARHQVNFVDLASELTKEELNIVYRKVRSLENKAI